MIGRGIWFLVGIFLLGLTFVGYAGEGKYPENIYFSLHQLKWPAVICSAYPDGRDISVPIDKCGAHDICAQINPKKPYTCRRFVRGLHDQLLYFLETGRENFSLSTDWEKNNLYFSGKWGPAGRLRHMKFFIPPGTYAFYIAIFVPQNEKIAFFLRMDHPPDHQKYSPDFARLNNITVFDLNDPLSYLRREDLVLENGGGTVPLQIHLGPVGSAGIDEDEAGWLYIDTIPYSSDTIFRVVVGGEVNLQKLKTWFESFHNWDENGDPIWDRRVFHNASGSEQVEVAMSCLKMGGKWCGGTCHFKNCPYCCGNSCSSKVCNGSSKVNGGTVAGSGSGGGQLGGSASGGYASPGHGWNVCGGGNCSGLYRCVVGFAGVWCGGQCYVGGAPASCTVPIKKNGHSQYQINLVTLAGN